MNKAPDAFRTISEVAEDLDIPQHVLRFWETRFTSIKPLKRGGGRRYYRPDDVELLKGIRQLLYGQGYTIKGVQRILKEQGPRIVQDVGRGGAPALEVPVEAYPTDPEVAEYEARGPAFLRPAATPVQPAGSASAAEYHYSPGREDVSPSHAIVDGRMANHGLPPRSASLGSSELDNLRAALVDLHECQRVLEGLARKD